MSEERDNAMRKALRNLIRDAYLRGWSDCQDFNGPFHDWSDEKIAEAEAYLEEVFND